MEASEIRPKRTDQNIQMPELFFLSSMTAMVA